MEVDFLCQPLPPTGWALINASGMLHLKALAEDDEQCKELPLLYIKMAVKDFVFSSRQVRRDHNQRRGGGGGEGSAKASHREGR